MTELVIKQQASGAVGNKCLKFYNSLHSLDVNSQVGVSLTVSIIFQQSQLFCWTVDYNTKIDY
jgi:hypothetical protein